MSPSRIVRNWAFATVAGVTLAVAWAVGTLAGVWCTVGMVVGYAQSYPICMSVLEERDEEDE